MISKTSSYRRREDGLFHAGTNANIKTSDVVVCIFVVQDGSKVLEVRMSDDEL